MKDDAVEKKARTMDNGIQSKVHGTVNKPVDERFEAVEKNARPGDEGVQRKIDGIETKIEEKLDNQAKSIEGKLDQAAAAAAKNQKETIESLQAMMRTRSQALPAASAHTVAVEETRLPAMTVFERVPASHTWIMNHAGTRQLTLDFLRANTAESCENSG